MEIFANVLDQIKVPTGNDSIYSEECVFSFDTPESESGLYVSLTSFLGFGFDFVEGYYQKTNHAAFLHIKRTKTEIQKDAIESEEEPEKKITRLAIGLDGGLQDDGANTKYTYHDTYNVVVFPSKVWIPFPDERLPSIVVKSVNAIISSDSALKKLEKEQLTGTWDGEMRQVSIHALDLQQLENGKKIPPTGWKCEECDLTTNLWLNLTDGSILCGRRFFDGTGGNEHAAQHYQRTKYPLAVKLGTITSDGKADVYSYAEDDMVVDPYLQKHLMHFGINIGLLEKTEKSMIEMEIELNQKVGEWALLQESSADLKPVAGPGLTGMMNLGNTCYMNSVMQVVFNVPDFIRRYVDGSHEIFTTFAGDPVSDFNVQMAKLGTGLCSGKYSKVSSESFDTNSGGGIKPVMFKNLIGKGHPDFSTKQQQDAQEFLLHLFGLIERNSRNQDNPTDSLKFKIEDRVQCTTSKKVKYSYRDEWILPVPIPVHLCSNLDEVHAYEEKCRQAEAEGRQLTDKIRPKIPLRVCLEKFADIDEVEQFYSTAINGKTTACKQARLATMPEFLLLHLKKFTLREDWTSMKLDVSVECPDELDINFLRGTGLLPSEEELPELKGKAPSPPPINQEILMNLQEMGFPVEACKKAIFFTKNTDLEAATNWIMQHIGDDDFNSPFVPPGQEMMMQEFVPNSEGLAMITSMGFTNNQAIKALKATGNNIERAVDYIFSHQDELDMEDIQTSETPTSSAAASQAKNYSDGDGKYRLKAFISHMGSSSQVGHYVCHILKDNQWVIFNDNKVALSQVPPKDLGYLYLYERVKN